MLTKFKVFIALQVRYVLHVKVTLYFRHSSFKLIPSPLDSRAEDVGARPCTPQVKSKRTPDDPVNPPIAYSGRCKHPYFDTECGTAKRDTIPIRVLADRPNLCWVSIAVLDEQRLGCCTRVEWQS